MGAGYPCQNPTELVVRIIGVQVGSACVVDYRKEGAYPIQNEEHELGGKAKP